MMKRDVIGEIKSAVKVSEFLRGIGCEVDNRHANVPWRSGSDSMALSILSGDDKWMDYAGCKHGTKAMGDVIDACELYYRCSTGEAIKRLCDRYGIGKGGMTEHPETGVLSFPVSQARMSFADDVAKKEVVADTVGNALNLIKGEQMPDSVRETIAAISECDDTKNGEVKRHGLKKTLLCLFFQGEFASRTELREMSGLCCMDIDRIGNPKEVKEKLKGDSHMLAMFVSPSGKGLKLVCRVDVEPFKDAKDYDDKLSMWKRMYGQLEKYYLDKYGFLEGYVDDCYKSMHQGCLLSLDSDLYMNVEAEAFKWKCDVGTEAIAEKKPAVEPVTVAKPEEKTAVDGKADIASLVPAKGLIRDYFDLYAGKTEVPDEAILAGGLCLVASAVGRKLFIEEAVRTYPNLYVLYVGASGLSKKSTAVQFARNFYYTLMKKQGAHDKQYSELSDAFSVEAVYEELKGRYLTAFVSEYGMMVGQKGYMENVKSLLINKAGKGSDPFDLLYLFIL